MIDQSGTVLDSITKQGNNFANQADETLSCPGSVDGWQDGYFDVSLSAAYNKQQNGAITIRVTNTLDQGANDESIGYGDMNFDYEFDPTVPWNPPRINNYDPADVDSTEQWQNNCGATEHTCDGKQYFGGTGECARGHQFWRTYKARLMPGATHVTFTGRIWTIDSWDGEQFQVQMTDEFGRVLAEQSYQGNNF